MFFSHFSFIISMNLTYILAFKSTLEMEPPTRRTISTFKMDDVFNGGENAYA